MAQCKKCNKRGLKPYGLSKRFYKCSCGYIGETPRKALENKKVEKNDAVEYENTCADDYLDYLSSRY